MTDRASFIAEILHTPYDPAVTHCWWLACVVEDALFGRHLPFIPAGLVSSVKTRAHVIADHPERERWREATVPSDGDLVLMGRTTRADLHCGVYLIGEGIIHTDAPHGVVIDRPAALQALGWRLTYWHPRTVE